MRFVGTLEAEPIAALAVDIRNAHILILDTVITALERTPPHVLVVIGVGFARPFQVSSLFFSSEEGHEHGVRHQNIEQVLGTLGEHCLEPNCCALLQIVQPVLAAELVSATQTYRLLLMFAPEFIVTNHAVTFVLGF